MGKDGSPIYDESELGYVLNQAFWGRGYMPEAGAGLIDYVTKERLFQKNMGEFAQRK
ncbi:GNAT family N-acetyltransferase [Secundilactobacillus collinoides]|uniref:GNAT family N-acetyltransferase n=1 Tax=Secundilactobacillus collinoides TaxID=33960 RepID=UPI0034E2922E